GTGVTSDSEFMRRPYRQWRPRQQASRTNEPRHERRVTSVSMIGRSRILGGIVIGIAAAGLLAALGAVLYTYSGHYNIAATAPHTDVVREWLNIGMRESVETRAAGIAAPPLDDPSLIHRGLREFESNCLPCHGTPGVGPTPMGVGLRPEAPKLSEAAPNWTAG